MSSVGLQPEMCFQLEGVTPGRSQFALIGHTDGRIGFGAKTAEGALAQVERGCAQTISVFVGNGAGRTDLGGWTRIEPMSKVNLRPAAGLSGHRRRCGRVRSGD